jgi:GcrA cell cycle regulator
MTGTEKARMAWTDERIALLKQYWEDGRSASQIAELLGEGLSRNAVIGKAHRLGLASRPSPLKTGEPKSADAKPAPRKTEKQGTAQARRSRAGRAAGRAHLRRRWSPGRCCCPRPRPSPVAEAPMPIAPARTQQPVRAKGAKVTLLDLNDRICKWPIGHPDEPDFHFCGKPVNAGFPYCQEHCLVAYQAQMPRRDRPGGPSRPFGPNLPRPR